MCSMHAWSPSSRLKPACSRRSLAASRRNLEGVFFADACGASVSIESCRGSAGRCEGSAGASSTSAECVPPRARSAAVGVGVAWPMSEADMVCGKLSSTVVTVWSCCPSRGASPGAAARSIESGRWNLGLTRPDCSLDLDAASSASATPRSEASCDSAPAASDRGTVRRPCSCGGRGPSPGPSGTGASEGAPCSFCSKSRDVGLVPKRGVHVVRKGGKALL
mmetsp:Transcript_22857/g.69971  ORF Transcript_22857/g.69971 Transcript_22857/m.69971 type:complete len:221 (+) Transcript_22857:1098-1760(+)